MAAIKDASISPNKNTIGSGGGGSRGETPEMMRSASFTDVEKCFLHALMVDDPKKQGKRASPWGLLTPIFEHKKSHPSAGVKTRNKGDQKEKRLDDSILFQLPFLGLGGNSDRPNTKFSRHPQQLTGLWKVHQEGAHPYLMSRMRSTSHISEKRRITNHSYENPQTGGGGPPSHRRTASNASAMSFASASTQGSSSICTEGVTVKTDAEVRPPDCDEDSSWEDEDGGAIHFNSWEVLRDEYAQDFGFAYNENMQTIAATLSGEDFDCQPHVFKILGTSVNDVEAQPHVLSPPLMDSLLNFVPESVSMQNYWLKFSLIRDGASLYTLKQYCKAAPYTILAIETTTGDVFGSFTSHTWKNQPSFYGSPPAFLWRMRQNRRTPCYSLFDQAQMESEIDVFAFSNLNDLVQVCDEKRLAIGGGKLRPDWDDRGDGERSASTTTNGIDVDTLDKGQNFGFGICLDSNLLCGSTSPCGTFRNPCLINNMSKGEVFEVANLEVWTFTPCADEKSAERMEMTRYFVEESVRSVTSNPHSTGDIYSNPYSSVDDYQREFYRRVGQNQPGRSSSSRIL